MPSSYSLGKGVSAPSGNDIRYTVSPSCDVERQGGGSVLFTNVVDLSGEEQADLAAHYAQTFRGCYRDGDMLRVGEFPPADVKGFDYATQQLPRPFVVMP